MKTAISKQANGLDGILKFVLKHNTAVKSWPTLAKNCSLSNEASCSQLPCYMHSRSVTGPSDRSAMHVTYKHALSLLLYVL